LGETEKAQALYAQAGDLRQAAHTLLDAGQPAAALQRYLEWEAQLAGADWLNRLRALLGQSACHHLGSRMGIAACSTKDAQTAYRKAMKLLQDAIELATVGRNKPVLSEVERLALAGGSGNANGQEPETVAERTYSGLLHDVSGILPQEAQAKNSRPETYFASVTAADLERERKVEDIVANNLADWQQQGLEDIRHITCFM
jgi:hypothetical protein